MGPRLRTTYTTNPGEAMNSVATSFVELLVPKAGRSVAEAQLDAKTAFPEFMDSSELRLWRPGQPVLTNGRRLLIGVATYSVYDLKLLDIVHAHLTSQKPFAGDAPISADEPLTIDVFDILDCQTQSDFERYIPGIGPISQSPVVGLWVDGELQEKAIGGLGRRLVYRICRLPTDETDQLIFRR